MDCMYKMNDGRCACSRSGQHLVECTREVRCDFGRPASEADAYKITIYDPKKEVEREAV